MLSISSQCAFCRSVVEQFLLYVVLSEFHRSCWPRFRFFIATGGFLFVLDAFDVKVMHTNID